MTDDIIERINTIYIISKGRPYCWTAQTLEKLNYKGAWFIVCGTNDDMLEAYKERWGDRVLVFDWDEEVTRTDLMDNFGWDTVQSGAAPVRNATRRISEERGELRHWQFDDDYTAFSIYDKETGKNRTVKDGNELQEWMGKIAYFGYKASLKNVGFMEQQPSQAPSNRYRSENRVFHAHNMPSDPELFQKWRGRLNDDGVNALDILRGGSRGFCFHFIQITAKQMKQEEGGLVDLYREVGVIRKISYAIMVAPQCVTMSVRGGSYLQKVKWSKLQAKILNERWKK